MASSFQVYQVCGQQQSYFINGAESQVLTMSVAPGASVQTEPGVMMHMSPNMKAQTDCRCCDFSRMCGGESCVVVTYTNDGAEPGYIGLTPNFPAKVIPVDLQAVKQSFIARRNAYLASEGDAKVGCSCDTNVFRACCGGMGFVRQHLTGTGTGFLAAGGTILQKVLQPNETIVVDPKSVLGWEESVTYGLQCSSCALCLCGNEAPFFATLTGPGVVFLESMSFEKFKNSIVPISEKRRQQAIELAQIAIEVAAK